MDFILTETIALFGLIMAFKFYIDKLLIQINYKLFY